MYKLWKRYLPERAKQWAMVAWYNLISRLDTGDDLLFLNHGYGPETGDSATLAPEDEKHRYPIQLYHHLAEPVDWSGKDALEVSSGRGGGADYVMRTFRPKSLTGLDIAVNSTEFCRRRYRTPGLRFETGDAQAMPFACASFDIVFNLESSLNYPNFAAFLAEVDRVLRPGGYFLIADYRRRKRLAEFEAALRGMDYEVRRIKNISAGIVRGLELTEAGRVAVIDRYAPRLLNGTIRRFARVDAKDDSERELFRTGRKGYLSAVLRKPGGAPD